MAINAVFSNYDIIIAAFYYSSLQMLDYLEIAYATHIFAGYVVALITRC